MTPIKDSKTLTDNPLDPDLNTSKGPGEQNKKYLVLSDLERSKGFVRPIRQRYIHTSCGVETIMGLALAETYARDPKFYTHTFCIYCKNHLPVSEFVWVENGTKTDQIVGS